MTSLTIRPLRSADVDPLAQLMAATPLWQRHHVTYAGATRRLQAGLENNATIDVAEVDGAAVGFIWYATRGIFLRSGYISLLGVSASQRGQGVGQALMGHAEQVIFAEVKEIFLLVSDFNGAAQRFYQRMGYQQVGGIPDYLTPGVTELLFMKKKESGVR
ncbi:MAG: GNAT family N-acetyltransferase [Caldilineaceae bacterium]|nr:GNAT family N-acetyltransferase [Caldilineaceae bacterium]MCB0141825.1 GNAT family N-acetyltransferase [Caldilineaceae bacterium]